MLSTPMSEQAIMLVLGIGSVFPRSSIYPKHSCSLFESLDHRRVKSDSHKACAHRYMYIQNTSIQVVQASQITISEVSPTVSSLFSVISTSTLNMKYINIYMYSTSSII